jgi:ABC-2 type transport system ATP-binding protein
MNQPVTQTIAFIQSVSKRYANTCALDNIDLHLKHGEVLAILGPNGAGKTTLINLLLGKLSLSAGDIQIFGMNPGSIALKRLCGAMLQVASLPETLKVKEHIQLFQSYYADPMDFQQVIQFAGLESIQEQFSKSLSGGQKQRLLFALAICGNPRLLFLDEPSVGLDVAARQKLWQAIKALKSQGTSIILTTHYLEEADQLADRIVMLNKGQIIQQGSPQAIKAQVLCQKIRFNSEIAIEKLADVVAIKKCEKTGETIELESTDPVASLRALFRIVEDIRELTVSGTALEDAFLQINRQNDDELSKDQVESSPR